MVKIILDTNFLIYCAEKKIDYTTEIERIMSEGYEICILSQVIKEIEELRLKATKFSDRQAAELALKIIKLNKIKMINSHGTYADEAIINLAKKEEIIVATLDKILAGRLKRQRKIRNITIQGEKRLVLL